VWGLTWVLGAASSIVDQYGPPAGVVGLASGLVYLVVRALNANDETLKPTQDENDRLRKRNRRLERDRAVLISALDRARVAIPPEVLADDS
jgi:hypothetical protein